MDSLEDGSRELQDYWNECRILQESRRLSQENEDEQHSPSGVEGECTDERDWLENAGLSEVTEPLFLSGREVSEQDLESALCLLSREQAMAVRRRVDSLNKTIRQRAARYRPRKDIRQVFADVERVSNDSRSRSATPDSLDSGPPSPHRDGFAPVSSPVSPANEHHLIIPGMVNRYEPRRRPTGCSPNSTSVISHQSLFRRASRTCGDVASETADGIRMTGYQRIGSVRVRSGSDPTALSNIEHQAHQDSQHAVVCVSRSTDDGLFNNEAPVEGRRHSDGSSHSDTLGFEETWAEDRLGSSLNISINDSLSSWDEGVGRTWVDFLAEEDMQTLRPLVFLELTALIDNAGIKIAKPKPYKRKRKEDGNLFGVSLSTLLERDRQITAESHSVPLIFQKILTELERRCLWEEGLLRVGGNKQRVESLCSKLEAQFYPRLELCDHLISTASPHDLTNVLKRLLRELPQPLLTTRFLNSFYQTHAMPECGRALNLLVLLLPAEHRATLQALLQFLSCVVSNSVHNKMSLRNVATIMAPSLFPPHLLDDKGCLKMKLSLAAHCCSLTELMIQSADRLWIVPENLVAQLRRINDNHKENKPKSRLLRRKGQIVTRSTVVRECEIPSSLIHVEAPQFLISCLPIPLDKQTTASQVVIRVAELSRECSRNVKSTRRDIKSRALSELAPNGNLSCLLSTGDRDTALRTHFLYEVGGNIGHRRLEPGAQLWAVYQSNPRAKWVIRCDHRNGSSHRLLKRL